MQYDPVRARRAGNDQPITPANRFFAAGHTLRVYDPGQGQALLEAGRPGHAQGRSFGRRCGLPRAVDTAVLFKEQRGQGRHRHQRRARARRRLLDDVWLKKPFVMCFWAGRPTEDWMFSQVYAKDAPWNDTHWKDERFNQLLA